MMPDILPALQRARTVLLSNQYFVLATVDSKGPWAATLAYEIGPPNCLYFFSQKTSRHGRALIAGGPVAGVIYDSRCTSAEAESIQFSGHGMAAHDRATIEKVLDIKSRRETKFALDPAMVTEALARPSTLLFRVCMTQAFVLDQELYASRGIDGREPVSIDDLFRSALA